MKTYKLEKSIRPFWEKLLNAFIVGIAVCLWAAAIFYFSFLFIINF